MKKSISEQFPYIPRKTISKFTNGLLSARYMANLDCKGLGPSGRVTIGGQIAYPVDSLMAWLESRTRVIA